LCVFSVPRCPRCRKAHLPLLPKKPRSSSPYAEQDPFDLNVNASRASRVHANFITDDTEQIAADANEIANSAATRYARNAHRFDHVQLVSKLARKRRLLELATGFPAPDDPKVQKELAQIEASLEGDYGKGKWCPQRGSFYGNKAAGEKLNAMLSMDQSKPWPDALEVLTGQKEMDATALTDYFAPLKTWLGEQNKKNGYPIGW
jgi:hypothetical protein